MRNEEATPKPPGKRPRKAVVRAVVLLIVAAVAAVGAAFLLTRYMDAKTAAARVPTQRVVVAKVPIPVASPIRAEWLAVVEWPVSAAPEGAETDPAKLVDRVAIVPIAKNDPVSAGKLAEPGARGGLAALLPDGMRAVSVKVDDVVGVAGFIHPGDRVDVIVTMKPKDDAPTFASKVILQNVRVLAVGKDVEQRGKEAEKAVAATVATLMVSPEESEQLALGATKGKLLLALRGVSDGELAQTRGVTPPLLLATTVPAPDPSRAPPAAKRPGARAATRPPAPPPTEKQRVEILRGDLFEQRDFAKAERR